MCKRWKALVGPIIVVERIKTVEFLGIIFSKTVARTSTAQHFLLHFLFGTFQKASCVGKVSSKYSTCIPVVCCRPRAWDKLLPRGPPLFPLLKSERRGSEPFFAPSPAFALQKWKEWSTLRQVLHSSPSPTTYSDTFLGYRLGPRLLCHTPYLDSRGCEPRARDVPNMCLSASWCFEMPRYGEMDINY